MIQPFYSSIFTQEKRYIHTEPCPQISTVALFAKAQTRKKKPTCSSSGIWINKNAADSNNKILLSNKKGRNYCYIPTTLANLKIIVLDEKKTYEKSIDYLILVI